MAEDFVLARLLGDVERKRVLELGCGDGTRAVELARRGANVIAVDPSTEAGLATRKRAETAEVRIELRTGDLADLAFLRGDSVDVAFAEGSLASLADLGRVLRQVQRVLRAGAWFVFSLPHPVAVLRRHRGRARRLAAARPCRTVDRSYFDDDVPYGADGPPAPRSPTSSRCSAGSGSGSTPCSSPSRPATARGRALLPDHRDLAGPQGRELTRARDGSPLVGPGAEPAVRLLLGDRALLEPDLEQERQRLAHDRARARRRGSPSPACRRAAA